MFINITKRKKELQQEIENLERQIVSLEDKKQDLTNDINDYNRIINSLRKDFKNVRTEALHACAPMVDLRFMKAFSIERFYKDEELITIIGYFKPDNTVGEWYLRCSDEQHRALIAEFRMLVPVPV